MKIFYSFTLIIIVYINSFSQENSILYASKMNNDIFVADHFQFFNDENNSESINTIQSKKFKKSKQKILNFGFKEGSVWVKFSIRNDLKNSLDKILQIQKPLQDSIVFFEQIDKNDWMIYLSGVKVKNRDKLIKGSAIYFPIKLEPSETKTFYIRVRSKYGISFASKIIDIQEYLNYRLAEMLIMALIIGALLSIAIYNLVIGKGFSDTTYYYYAALIITTTLIQATVRGFFFNYIHIESDFIREWWPPFIIATGVILFSLFSIRFLQAAKYNRTANYILKALIYFTLFGLVIEFVSFEFFGIYTTNKLVALATMIVGFAALFSGIIVYRKGNKFARYFIIAWFFYSFSIVIYVGTLLAVLEITWFTTNAYMLGSFLEVTFLSLALVERYKILIEDKKNVEFNLNRINVEVNLKDSEISKLITESISHIESKTKLTEQLKEISKSNDKFSLQTIIADLNVEKLDNEKKLMYKQNLDKVNELFITRLKKAYPVLTDTDIEMAVFAKMSLSTKEMANLRNTSIEAIKKNRYRLRKKINLKDGESLEYFMSKF